MGDSPRTLRYVDVSPTSKSNIAEPNIGIQIGINLSDPMFQGSYHGKQAHEADLDDVIQRAKDVGCAKFMVTGSDLVESAQAINIAKKYRQFSPAVSPPRSH